MTPAEKLTLAQRSYAAFSAGPDLEALIPLYHPELVWRMGSMGAAFGTEAFRGHDGLREFASALKEGTESLATTIDEARITSEGVLLISNTTYMRSSGVTNIELSTKGWQEGEFRDGLILTVVQLDEPPSGWDEATPVN